MMLTTADLEREQYISRRVIVRIWTSAGNPHHPGANVGHVSVETPNRYISIWPRQRADDLPAAKEAEGLGVTSPITPELLINYEKDREYEGRNPEKIYCFYTLNYLAMEEAFEALKTRLTGWALLGGVICTNAESCASGAYRILQAGGIQDLTPSKPRQSSMLSGESGLGFWHKGSHSAAGSSYLLTGDTDRSQTESQASTAASIYSLEMGLGGIIESPDKLALILEEAKRQELRNNSALGAIEFSGETPVVVQAPSRCCIQ